MSTKASYKITVNDTDGHNYQVFLTASVKLYGEELASLTVKGSQYSKSGAIQGTLESAQKLIDCAEKAMGELKNR